MGISTGERSDRRQRVAALLATGVILAAAAGLLWNAASRRATPTVAADDATDTGQAVPWDGGLLDEHRLTLYFTGARPLQADDPCSRAYEAVAEPADDTVVVTVHALAGSRVPPGQGCEDVGYERSVTLELAEPLQGRPVVDGASGQRQRVRDAATLLTPSWLPNGYRLARQYVESSIDVREWARDGRPDERLTIERGSVDEVARPGYEPMVLDEPTVRGVPATVWKSRGFDDLVCVSWAEGGKGHRVCSGGAPGQLLANDVLVRVANGLRDRDALPSDARPSDDQTAVTDPEGT